MLRDFRLEIKRKLAVLGQLIGISEMDRRTKGSLLNVFADQRDLRPRGGDDRGDVEDAPVFECNARRQLGIRLEGSEIARILGDQFERLLAAGGESTVRRKAHRL